MATTPQFAKETGDGGRFERQSSAFRGVETERPAPGRFHLYVSLACPWAHRTIIARRIKGLEDLLPMTIVDPLRDELGWRFTDEDPDPVHGFAYLSGAYTLTDPGFDARVTVPTLFDKDADAILNNESEDVLRMLNAWGTEGPDLFPEAHRDEILELNARVYDAVNNGVYKAGFASSQEAYEEAFDALFAELDALEERLADRRYLVGDALTEADIRLYTTLVRFDAVYVGHFKCNLRRIADYPNLSQYLRDLYQHPGFGETTDFDHIKRHYYLTHLAINGNGLLPKGPELDLDAPHDRDRLGPRTL